jgi:TRAP-type C4-dicarboxylate transport system substrate-binding protein
MGLLVLAPAATAQNLRIATLAPRQSTWGKLFAVWQRVIEEKTKGALKVDVFFNAVMGDEAAMVAKMRTGQIDGAALSAIGLSIIYRDAMVLQLPGVVNSWPLADLVRSMMQGPILDGFRDKGFEIVGWGDIGTVHQMSKGFAVRGPQSLRGRRPMVYRNEPIGPMIYSLIGQVVPIPLGTTDVLPAVQAGTVDVIAAPVLAAEQLQWTPFVDHIGEQSILCAVGATVLRKDKHDSIPVDAREMLKDLHRRTAGIQNDRIRKLDDEAFDRISRKMEVVRLTDDEKVEWYRVFLKAVKKMRYGIFSPKLIDQVLAITGKN